MHTESNKNPQTAQDTDKYQYGKKKKKKFFNDGKCVFYDKEQSKNMHFCGFESHSSSTVRCNTVNSVFHAHMHVQNTHIYKMINPLTVRAKIFQGCNIAKIKGWTQHWAETVKQEPVRRRSASFALRLCEILQGFLWLSCGESLTFSTIISLSTKVAFRAALRLFVASQAAPSPWLSRARTALTSGRGNGLLRDASSALCYRRRTVVPAF